MTHFWRNEAECAIEESPTLLPAFLFQNMSKTEIDEHWFLPQRTEHKIFWIHVPVDYAVAVHLS